MRTLNAIKAMIFTGMICAFPIAFAEEDAGTSFPAQETTTMNEAKAAQGAKIDVAIIENAGIYEALEMGKYREGFIQTGESDDWKETRVLDIEAWEENPQKIDSVDYVNGITNGSDITSSQVIDGVEWEGKTTTQIKKYEEDGDFLYRSEKIYGYFESEDGRIMSTDVYNVASGSEREIDGTFQYGKKDEEEYAITGIITSTKGELSATSAKFKYKVNAKTADGKYEIFINYEVTNNNIYGRYKIYDMESEDVFAPPTQSGAIFGYSNEPNLVADMDKISKILENQPQE